MADFRVPVREGKDDFGFVVDVEIRELWQRPGTAVVFRHPQHGTHEYLHWEGRLLRPFPGLRGTTVDVATLGSLLVLGQTTDPFGRDYWKSPFEPSRFAQDRRGTNPFAGKRLTRQAKAAIRRREIMEAAADLVFVQGELWYAVEEPVLKLSLNRLRPDGEVTVVPDFGENGLVESDWVNFRLDRMGDAMACAEAYAEGTGGKAVPMEGSMDLLMSEVLKRNDVEDTARHCLNSFTMFVKEFPALRTPEALAVSKKVTAFLGDAPDFRSPDVADAAFVLVADAVDVMRGIDPSRGENPSGVSTSMLHKAILENLVYSCVRYSSFDRDWLESQQGLALPTP